MKLLHYYFAAAFILLVINCEMEDGILPQKSTKILFLSQRIENKAEWNLFSMNIDGTEQRKIIMKAMCPVWSPEGKRIAYQSAISNGSSQIFVANNDGTNQKQLTSTYSSRFWPGWAPDGNYDPQWTPDGKKIVYVSWEDEDPEIHSMNSDGSNKVKLTNTEKRDENPEITSDGKFILFSSKRNMEMGTEIFIMDLNGKNQRPISNYSRSDIYPVEIR